MLMKMKDGREVEVLWQFDLNSCAASLIVGDTAKRKHTYVPIAKFKADGRVIFDLDKIKTLGFSVEQAQFGEGA